MGCTVVWGYNSRREAAEAWNKDVSLIILNKKMEGTKMGNKYYIIRADRAGVFAGNVKSRDGGEVTMTDVRRLWYWDGAASLSQLAVDGTCEPGNCKFTVTVPEMTILGVIEIIPCSSAAEVSIKAVPIWRR